MGMEDFFAQLPRGKDDKPLLFGMEPLIYDFHDIDGLYYMLDQKLSGCLILMWAKPMNPAIRGFVTLNGREIGGWVNQYMAIMGNMWILGIPLRGHVTEYGKEYQLHVEGFVDEDGNEMNPHDFVVTGIEKTEPLQEYEEHETVALECAREGIVLLKNENHVLPLSSGETLNFFGKGVHEFRIGAVGAGKINPRYSINLIEAARMSKDYDVNEELVDFYSCDRDLIPDQAMIERAKGKNDKAIVFLTRASGENQDASTAKGEYYLSEEEENLIAFVSQTFARTIVVLNVSYPIDVRFAEKYKVDGLIYLGLAGMLAGPALMDIMTGKVNPSGKLPDTWAYDYFDIPASKNFYDCVDKPRLTAESDLYVDTYYEEDIYVGYRYFTTFKKNAAYPFGFGLSYTSFSVEAMAPVFDGENMTLNVRVKNTGICCGKEVVQVYAGKPETEQEQPERELVYFEKTRMLAPNEEQSLVVVIPKAHLTTYSEEKAAYILSEGEYSVFAGSSVDAPLCGMIQIEQTQIIKQVTNLLAPGEELNRLSKKQSDKSAPKGKKSGVIEGKSSFMPYAKRKSYPAHFSAKAPNAKLMFDDVRKNPENAELFVAQMTKEELARISVCASSGWGMEGIGEAGRVYKIDGYEMPDFPVSDGNSGVNLNMKNIGMPSGVTICATFNKKLAKEVGKVIGEEAKAFGVPLILAPAFNIHRNPLNGRQPEYFSEDPYLSGVMAGCYAKGMEGAGVGSCYKHFLGNNCESTRKRNQSVISERAIREIYFKTFEYAMEVHMPASYMTAYNAVNGCPTAADAELIQGLLREENGFDGFVMTDWTSYDTVDVASMIEAGNCWITPGALDNTYTDMILKGLEDGSIQLGRLQENVTAFVRTMARFA